MVEMFGAERPISLSIARDRPHPVRRAILLHVANRNMRLPIVNVLQTMIAEHRLKSFQDHTGETKVMELENPEVIISFLVKVAAALVILVIGNWVAGIVSKAIRKRGQNNPRVDQTLANFFASLAKYAIITIAVITALSTAGVQATSLVAVVGALTLAIGFALQGALSNVAAGVLIIFFRPYKLGDYVEIAGVAGTVKDISLFTTELATPDNVQIIVPNGEAWSGVITNYSAHPTRRVDITFGISYDDDIQKATDIILEVVRGDMRYINDPAEPWVRVINLGESSVDLQLRAWVHAPDYWETKFQTTRAVKEAFDARGIEIPYPHSVEIQKNVAA